MAWGHLFPHTTSLQRIKCVTLSGHLTVQESFPLLILSLALSLLLFNIRHNSLILILILMTTLHIAPWQLSYFRFFSAILNAFFSFFLFFIVIALHLFAYVAFAFFLLLFIFLCPPNIDRSKSSLFPLPFLSLHMELFWQFLFSFSWWDTHSSRLKRWKKEKKSTL